MWTELVFLIGASLGAVIAGFAYRKVRTDGRVNEALALEDRHHTLMQGMVQSALVVRIDPTEPVYTRAAVMQRIAAKNPEIARDILKALHDEQPACSDTSHHYEITIIETFEGSVRRDGYCYDCKVPFVEDLP